MFLIATGCEGVAGQNERANFQFQRLSRMYERNGLPVGRLTTIYRLRMLPLLVGWLGPVSTFTNFSTICGEGASGCRLLRHLPLLCLVWWPVANAEHCDYSITQLF